MRNGVGHSNRGWGAYGGQSVGTLARPWRGSRGRRARASLYQGARRGLALTGGKRGWIGIDSGMGRRQLSTQDPARRMKLNPPASGQIASAPIACPRGSPATAVSGALAAIGLRGPRPVLILVGGAASLDGGVAAQLLPLFTGLVPLLDRLGVAVIDGGTPFGVMALMGTARQRAAGGFPLIGIAPRGRVDAPAGIPPGGQGGSSALASDASGGCFHPDQAEAEVPVAGPKGPLPEPAPRPDRGDIEPRVTLDPHHSHFLLVPGERWGDESPWLTAAAECLAGGQGSLMLVAGGGEVTRRDVLHRLRQRGRVLALAGSGGTADALVAWCRGGQPPPLAELMGADHARIEVLDLMAARDQMPRLLARAFSTRKREQ